MRSATPAWDREAARRAVLAAVLADVATGPDAEARGVVLVVDDTLQPSSVYDADHVPKPDRVGDVVPLPDGRKVYRPAIETLAAEAFDDWIAHTAPVPAPREITSPLPIEWFSEPPETESPAPARPRTRESAGFVRVSDVGFSASHRQALVQAMHGTDGCSVGAWLLLEREGGRWKIVSRRRTFIACGCGLSPNITPTD